MAAGSALVSAVLEFDGDAHAYRLNGRPVPGVTQVLEPLNQFDDIPPEVLAAAAERGRQVHEACHLHNVDDLDWSSLSEEVAGYVTGYVRFLRESRLQVFLSEARVASPKYGYAGTLDLFGALPTSRKADRAALIDVKSTAAFPRPVGPQVAAYAQALQETTGDKASARYCLHLRPNGTYKLHALTGQQDFTVFMSCLNLHRWLASA